MLFALQYTAVGPKLPDTSASQSESWLQGVRPAATWHAATATGGQHERRHDTASCQVVPAAALHSESQPPGSTLIPKTQQSLGLVGAALLQKPVTMPAMAPQSLWDTVMPAHDLVTSSDEEGDAQPEGDLEVVDMLMSLAAGKAVRPKQASRQALWPMHS